MYNSIWSYILNENYTDQPVFSRTIAMPIPYDFTRIEESSDLSIVLNLLKGDTTIPETKYINLHQLIKVAFASDLRSWATAIDSINTYPSDNEFITDETDVTITTTVGSSRLMLVGNVNSESLNHNIKHSYQITVINYTQISIRNYQTNEVIYKMYTLNEDTGLTSNVPLDNNELFFVLFNPSLADSYIVEIKPRANPNLMTLLNTLDNSKNSIDSVLADAPAPIFMTWQKSKNAFNRLAAVVIGVTYAINDLREKQGLDYVDVDYEAVNSIETLINHVS